MLDELPARKVLLVEGASDEHVVRHLCRRHQNMPAFDIIDKRGFQNLKSAIGPEIKVSGRTALGILVDANDRPTDRWAEILHQVAQAVGQVPTQMVRSGTILGVRPRVGIWLMPDNQTTGELENFIEQLIPVGDPVWPRAQEYIDGIPVADRKFKKVLRAQIHAWLATRQEPRKMGAAIGIGDLDAAALPAQQFSNWLRRLFG